LGRVGNPQTGLDNGEGVTIRVLLADDQELLRLGFRMILAQEPDIEVVGEAGNGEEAIALASSCNPDVVLMDVRMPVIDGIEATRRIVSDNPAIRVLVLTTFDLDAYAFGALRVGASGFLLKDVPPDELAAGIRIVASGDAVVSPRVTRRLLDEYAHVLDVPGTPDRAQSARTVAKLTDRENEVLVAVAEGLSNAEIAERLFVSEATVKSHVGRILGKLGLRDRVQAVVFAFRAGIVRPDSKP
jgi:DNA-binding NarL/FixJ family response regulator